MIEEKDGNWELAGASERKCSRRIAATSVPLAAPDVERPQDADIERIRRELKDVASL